MRQQFLEPLEGMFGDAAENVAEPGKGINPDKLQEETKLRSTAAVLPPLSLPKKVQLLRPSAKLRNDRSVALLSIDRSPSEQ